MRPLCFVLMPFGKKRDETGREIDFNAIYDRIIAPAAMQAGLDVIRADEEQVGGTIHKAMFERLLLCEYAIADLTTANPNVYYELGVRHAVRPRSTVILFAAGTNLPFDVAPLRGLPYRIDGLGAPIDPAVCAGTIAQRLTVLRDEHADDSPVFQLIGDMPRIEIDHEKTDLFRQRTDYSLRIKKRLAKAREEGPDAVRRFAAEPEFADVANLEAGVVLDLYLSFLDVQAHDAMVALYERMARPLQGARLVQEQLGFALNRLGRSAEAERVLKEVITQYGPSSETCGLLGRVYKDRWETARRAGDRLRGARSSQTGGRSLSRRVRGGLARRLSRYQRDDAHGTWRGARPPTSRGRTGGTLCCRPQNFGRQRHLLGPRYAAGDRSADA